MPFNSSNPIPPSKASFQQHVSTSTNTPSTNTPIRFATKSFLGFNKIMFVNDLSQQNTTDKQITKLQAESSERGFGFYDPTTSTIKVDQKFIDLMEKRKINKIVYQKSDGQVIKLSNKNIQALNGQEAKELSRAVNDFMQARAQLRMNEAAALKERNNHEKESSFEDKDHEISNNTTVYRER